MSFIMNNIVYDKLMYKQTIDPASGMGLSLTQHVYADTDEVAKLVQTIDSTMPTQIRFVGSHQVFVHTHFVTELANQLIEKYTNWQNMQTNVTIQLDTDMVKPYFTDEFDQVIVIPQ